MTHFLPISFDPRFFCSIDSIVHIYTTNISGSLESMRHAVFGNCSIVGGSKIDRGYFSIIDPLFASYNTIRNLILEISDNAVVPMSQLPEKLSLPLLNNPSNKTSFYEVISTHSSLEATTKIVEEIEALSDLIHFTLNHLFDLSIFQSSKVMNIYKIKLHKEIWQHFQEYIQIEEVSEFSAMYTEQGRINSKAFQIRDCPYFNHLETLPLQAEDLYNENLCHPIFFIHSDYMHIKSLIDETFGKTLDIHIMVLVHGYKGSAIDMHMIKGYINMIYPSVHVYSSRINENFTDFNIEILGDNLAEEVIHYLHDVKVPKHRLKLSFIGHSMGGLILRAALPALKDYKACMHSFTTFSSPHIGIVYTDNLMLKFGKWVLKKLQKSTSFNQMTMKDSKDYKETFIYRLSQANGLDWFKHVLLFSCGDDPYVPVDSAGIFIPPLSVGTNKELNFREIVENILKNISVNKLIRIDVNFKYRQVLDSCVCCGNRHIDFLDDPCFIKMFCYSMPGLFYNYY